MAKKHVLKRGLLGIGLLGNALAAAAQSAPVELTSAPVPPRVLLKAGLRLTHLSYSPGNQAWRLVVPLSVGAEYRLSSRFGVYTQAEADLQTSRTAGRRRSQLATGLPDATLSLGMRYYYRQPHKGEARRGNNLYGNYLSLEGNAERLEITSSYVALPRRQTLTSLTPGLYAFWGTQHQLRHALLYDINAGLGFQAPPYYNFEHVVPAHYNVVAQVNLRLYWGVGL